MMNLNLMREIVNSAILTKQEETIRINDGYVFENKRSDASNYWIIVTHDE